MIKISVIIAVYNAEKYLRECLDSIVNQTYKNIEIICVNDGSSDSSLEILKEYAANDDRMYIFTKENEGLGGASARNYGLNKATGKYVSILDSDDFFEPDMLEKAVKIAENTGVDFVIFGGDEYDNNTGKYNNVSSILNQSVIPAKEVFSYQDCPNTIFQLTQGMAWNKLFRKSYLDDNGIRFQRIKYTDDAYFTFANLVCAKKITVLNEVLCHYRVNSGINQTSGLAQYPDSSFGPYFKLKELFEKWGVFDEIKQSFVNCTATFLRYFCDRIDKWEAFEYLYGRYRTDVFYKLCISNQDINYFYDPLVYEWVQTVLKYEAGETAFEAARAYGDENTTASLRFSISDLKIPNGSRVALIGAGITGRHYFAQMIIAGIYDVPIWCEESNPGKYSYIKPIDKLFEVEFDYVLIAYKRKDLISSVTEKLIQNGIEKNKILIGGED